MCSDHKVRRLFAQKYRNYDGCSDEWERDVELDDSGTVLSGNVGQLKYPGGYQLPRMKSIQCIVS